MARGFCLVHFRPGFGVQILSPANVPAKSATILVYLHYCCLVCAMASRKRRTFATKSKVHGGHQCSLFYSIATMLGLEVVN